MALTYPLITVGTRMQVQKSQRLSKGFLQTMQAILAKEGPAGLYT